MTFVTTDETSEIVPEFLKPHPPQDVRADGLYVGADIVFSARYDCRGRVSGFRDGGNKVEILTTSGATVVRNATSVRLVGANIPSAPGDVVQ